MLGPHDRVRDGRTDSQAKQSTAAASKDVAAKKKQSVDKACFAAAELLYGERCEGGIKNENTCPSTLESH